MYLYSYPSTLDWQQAVLEQFKVRLKMTIE
jgi:hypothetical protein